MKQENSRNNEISWGPICHFPCPNGELQLILTCPESPLIPLGRSLDLLSVVWGQLRHWPSPISVCTFPQSPQLLMLDQPQNVGTLIVYSDIPQTKNIPSWLQRLNPQLVQLHGEISILLSCTALGAQLSFWPQLYMWATLPTEVRGVKSTSLLGYLTQASEGYGGQRWGVHQVPMVAVTCRELQQTGPSLWWESFPVSAEAGAGMWRQWWPCPLWTTQQWHLIS